MTIGIVLTENAQSKRQQRAAGGAVPGSSVNKLKEGSALLCGMDRDNVQLLLRPCVL